MNLEFPASVAAQGGARSAYQKADRLTLRFADAQATREQSQANFDGATPETRVSMVVKLHKATETLDLDLQLLRGNDALFRGSEPVILRAGRTTTVTVTLIPVVAGVIAPDSVATLTAYGQTVQLTGVAIFATGDTIDGASVNWTSLDAGIASIDNAGVLVARADGLAHLVASADNFADTTTARVLATVNTITVTPNDASIQIGADEQFAAMMFDRNGNPIPTRPVVWSSTAPSVISIDANGRGHGTGIGSATITATVGGTAGSALANGVPAPPLVDSLKAVIVAPGIVTLTAEVTANGAPTFAWFEWVAPALPPGPPALTLKQLVGEALQPFPVLTTLRGLRSNTQYVARINASNSAGSVRSDSITFFIPAIGPSVQTGDTANYMPGKITLTGSVNPNGVTVDGWFQISTDPFFATYDSASVGTISGFNSTAVYASVAVGPPGTAYWYRLVGRSSLGIAYGSTLSFTVPAAPGPPTATTDQPVISPPRDATFQGTVNPNGLATEVWFEWGTSPDPSTFTMTPIQQAGSGTVQLTFTQLLTHLPDDFTIYYRIVTRNSAGTTYGNLVSFHL